jgi:hypothetical protein
MALQTSDLVMVALGVDGDAPPLALQPPLVDGIHLRWAFQRAHGFPWYGYYLFRRPHEFRGERCLAPELAAHAPGTDLGTSVSTALGMLSSSDPIVVSEVAPPANRVEISLESHSTMRLDLPPGEPAFRVRVRVVFLQADTQLRCIDFRKLRPDLHPNPLSIGKVTFAVRDARGKLVPRIRLVTPVSDARMDVALDTDALLEVTLPVATRSARLDVTGEGSGSIIEALDDVGRVVASVRPQLNPLRPTTVEVSATADFRRLQVHTRSGLTLLHRLCWITPARDVKIPVAIYDGPMVVGRATLAGAVGAAAEALLSFDRITAVEIGGGQAVLVDLCAQIVPDVARKNWQPVPDCPQPILFPLTHPDYPLAAAPEDIPAAETRALQRIVYGPSGAWAGASFKSLYKCLRALIAGGPPGPPARAMAAPERAAQNVAGVPTPAAPGLDVPSVPSLHPLDLVLLGSLHPAVAQMVGMYWADKTANPRTAYDYMIVADHRNIGVGKAATLMEYISRNGFADVDAWIVFDRRMTPPARPLAAPVGVRAYSLPGGTYRGPSGVNANVQDADGNVGLTWPRPLDEQGYLRPEQPVLYHVWRDDQGNAANPQPSPQAETLVTARGPLLAARAPGIPPESAQYPGDWPPFSLAALDFALSEGWYGYQINAIDIFGRFSPRSAFAEWHQWVPAPNPKPWYYIDPPADRVVHASSVRVLDRTPPPPPAFVEAWVLDPADPVVVRDAALDTWRAGLPAAQRNTLIGLRVRWRWTVAQQRQAPDTQEFRIYWNPGTTPPPEWERVASWLLRGHVTPYASNVTVAAGGDRSYDVFLPIAAGQGPFGAGVPLNPTRADPLLYANVTVTAADDSPHAQDTWPGAGPFAGRSGNESRAASPSRVYRVLRDPPPPPEPVVDSDRVYATPADWHARSYYTFRWRTQPNLFTHVLRAMDESVFAADWARRPRAVLQPGDAARFPDPAAEPTWNAAKRQIVCDALNPLNAIPKTDAGRLQAFAAYRALSDDALRVLANLPGNEKAFVQLTLQALDAGDPATADRRGPDDPPNYVPRPALRAYTDTLDGRATNRYLYRAVYVDAAQNRSAMGPIGTPVRLPNVVPPRAPAITKVTGGDRQITLAWASNREADLIEYRVFRTDRKDAAEDIRRMTQVAVVAADPDPAARPAAVQWTDQPVPGLKDFYYRIVAVDRPDPIDPRGGGGNVSMPSQVVKARAVDTMPPTSPTWMAAERLGGGGGVRLAWRTDETDITCIVYRRLLGGVWRPASQRLVPSVAPFDFEFVDVDAPPGTTYEYRVVVEDPAGNRNRDTEIRTV